MIAASRAIDWMALGHAFCTGSRLVKSALARINCVYRFLHPQAPLIDTKGVALRFLKTFINLSRPSWVFFFPLPHLLAFLHLHLLPLGRSFKNLIAGRNFEFQGVCLGNFPNLLCHQNIKITPRLLAPPTPSQVSKCTMSDS